MNHDRLSQVARISLPSDQDATGRTLGEEEISALAQVVHSGTLTSVKGSAVKTLEKHFAAAIGAEHVFACSSGSAAVHAAIAAINPDPGDEIVTTPITDMGALTPILYQGAIPVFADVDPRTCNVTARTIEPCLSQRTRAIVVTHLFGNPCDMGPILSLASARHIPVIEDAAQALGARWRERAAGTLGTIGCFSLQQGKHITTGEGGVVVTDDSSLARRIFLFINKAWGYGDAKPDHYFLALNYRMSELQGAVALAQLPKLDGAVRRRIEMAGRLTERLQGLSGFALSGVATPPIEPEARHSYWKYCLRVDAQRVSGGAEGMGKILKEHGIASAPRYIQKPAFMCEIFAARRTFGNSHYPFTLARPEAIDYSPERFPGTFKALEQVLVLPWNERYEAVHVDYIAQAVERAVEHLGAAQDLRGHP
ncbi:MAG: DegT/DnrJ/EryC1/StrS family aminotransferase [Planctomycetota bacterium]